MRVQSQSWYLGIYDDCGTISVFHVDKILIDKKNQEEVIKECLSADIDFGKSIILFASPQAISENEFW
jgi:hypothetical protein